MTSNDQYYGYMLFERHTLNAFKSTEWRKNGPFNFVVYLLLLQLY